jgi:hypothetical protein
MPMTWAPEKLSPGDERECRYHEIPAVAGNSDSHGKRHTRTLTPLPFTGVPLPLFLLRRTNKTRLPRLLSMCVIFFESTGVLQRPTQAAV